MTNLDDLHTPLKFGDHIVPGLWRYLLPEDVQFFRPPRESKATCNQCPMIAEEGMHPAYRCCTYIPRLPNFYLGLALENTKTAPLVEQLVDGGFATPEGMHATTALARAGIQQIAENNFGKDAQVICPFLDQAGKRCGIYLYRNAVCSTWFCKHDHGTDSKEFWENLQATASQVEVSLTQWAMAKLGVDPKLYMQKFDTWGTRLDGSIAPESDAWSGEFLAEMWAQWRGKELEYFRAAAALIRDHKDQLFDIARGVNIVQPHGYNRAFHAALSPEMQASNEEAETIDGQPVPIDDLVYTLNVSHSRVSRRMPPSE